MSRGFDRVSVSRTALVIGAFVTLLSACGVEEARTHRLFGETERLSEVLGTEIVSSYVVPMTCIPQRTDPVGVFLGLEITDWQVTGDQVTVSIQTNHARLGSHPSGCADLAIVTVDSMFLIGPDDETVHATEMLFGGDGTTLVFDLGGRRPEEWSAVLLPTITYSLANGERQTSIYGLVGHYELG